MADMLLMSAIVFSGRVWTLRIPVVAEILETLDGIQMRCALLGIDILAPDRSAAYKDFQEEFSVAYELYYDEPDEALTLDALEIKQHLHLVIASVDDVAGKEE
jgi:hypothetical protein